MGYQPELQPFLKKLVVDILNSDPKITNNSATAAPKNLVAESAELAAISHKEL